jgi:hypothetical protein
LKKVKYIIHIEICIYYCISINLGNAHDTDGKVKYVPVGLPSTSFINLALQSWRVSHGITNSAFEALKPIITYGIGNVSSESAVVVHELKVNKMVACIICHKLYTIEAENENRSCCGFELFKRVLLMKIYNSEKSLIDI